MPDANSAQPIRTWTNADAVVGIADSTTPGNTLTVDSSGKISDKLNDGAGNPITSQVNGAQRALDVGIDVAGVQIDPRSIRALTSSDTVTVVQPTGTNLHTVVDSGTITANQGTPAITANAWPTKVTDGTNTAAVKAASTVALATDPSLVVALSPNSPVPAGSNTIGNINVYSGGSPNANANPLFVTVTNTTPGTPVNYYNATANIGLAGTDSTSVYTITASKTLSVKKVFISSSIRLRADFQTSPNGSTWTTIFSTFTSASVGYATFDTDSVSIQDSGSGSAVRVVFTNEDIKVGGAYATILATEN